MKFSIRYKVYLAFLLLSILPLIMLSYLSIYSLKETGRKLIEDSIGNLEKEEEKRLIKEAENYARNVTDFLNERARELKELALMPLTEKSLLQFYETKKGKVWHAIKTSNGMKEVKEYLPLYKEISYVDATGNEKIVIKKGKLLPAQALKNIANPANTTYLTEDYFNKTRSLKAGEIYLSELKGFAMTRQEQIGNALKPEDVKGGNHYDGVLRFSMPIYEKSVFKGVLSIALDHIHLQELTIHIDPRYGSNTVYAGYESGNYAFIFDISGWIITHPKYWDLPGVFKNGKEKRYMTANSSKRDIEEGIEGFNLYYAGFISEGYPLAAKEVRKGKKGIVTVTNVGGVRKVMAYAPIFCSFKPYDKLNIFGGFTLGEKLEDFSESATHSQQTLIDMLDTHQKNIAALFLFIIFLVALLGAVFSNHITAPILALSKKSRFIGETSFDYWEKIERNDEIGELAKLFYEMNKKINEQTNELKASMAELQKTKQQLEEYNLHLKKEIDLLKDEKFRQVDRLSSIGRLAAGLAHEIRNPLTGITLFLDDLHDRISNDTESQKLIVHALQEIERVERLISELLYFSASKPSQRTEFEISSLLDSISVFVNKICQKNRIEVVLDVKKGLNILGDKERLKQALLNVVLNAVQAMDNGGVLTIIAKSVKKDDTDFVLIQIMDTGSGIDDADLERIFEPFYTLRKEGTGLGLAIARSIINEHEGTIFAKNWEKGALFEIWLPLN